MKVTDIWYFMQFNVEYNNNRKQYRVKNNFLREADKRWTKQFGFLTNSNQYSILEYSQKDTHGGVLLRDRYSLTEVLQLYQNRIPPYLFPCKSSENFQNSFSAEHNSQLLP